MKPVVCEKICSYIMNLIFVSTAISLMWFGHCRPQNSAISLEAEENVDFILDPENNDTVSIEKNNDLSSNEINKDNLRQEKVEPVDMTEEKEDQLAMDEAIAHFGSPQDYKKFNLPGPELNTFDLESIPSKDEFINNDGSGNYSFGFHTFTLADFLSYNGRYEVGELKKVDNDNEIIVVKGQYAEKLKRKNGGFYIRTIGYVADENGYRPFLINLSSAKFASDTGLIGIRIADKSAVSSVVLNTLLGGNVG